MLKYKLYLKDIERAIKNIEESTKKMSFSDFNQDLDKVDSNAMRIQIIGESLKNIPDKLWKDSSFDKKSLVDFRNIISHAYFKVNSFLLWDIIQNKIPILKKEVKRILRELENEK